MLYILAKPHSTGMRTYGNIEFGSHQQNRQYLVHTPYAAAIDLADSDGTGLHQLFEHHAILTMLPRGDMYRGNGLGNFGMPKNIIGTRRLLDPPWIEFRQLFHICNSLVDIPFLVGVHHEP